jgi:alpha-mannosidase
MNKRSKNEEADSVIEHVIVTYKTHFDIGFTDLASTVIHRYRTEFVDRCLEILDKSRELPPDQRFKWVVPGWPLEKMIEEWDGQTEARKKRLNAALKNDQIVPHALSFSTHTGTMDLEELVRSLGPTYRVGRRAGRPLPTSGKMTDVPGHTWILPTFLHAAGITFMHIGDNDNSAPCQVPPLFWWEGPDGSRVLTMYAPLYTFGMFPPEGWKLKTWLALIMTCDNMGPPSPEQVLADIGKLKEAFPGANVRAGTMGDFAKLVIEEAPELPVVRKDLADSWILGTQSMPQAAMVARNARARAEAAGSLETYLAFAGVDAYRTPLRTIYDDTARFAEHTYGADYKKFYNTRRTSHGWSDQRAEWHRYGQEWRDDMENAPPELLMDSWKEKAAHAYRAEAATVEALSENMRKLAASVGVDGDRVIVFNPLPFTRGGVVEVDGAAPATGRLRNLRTDAIVAVETTAAGFRFMADDVPGCGYITFVPAEGEAEPNRDLATDEAAGIIENRFFRIRFAPETGSIASIVEKNTGRELVNGDSTYKFGQYLYERFSQEDLERYDGAYIRAKWAHLDHLRSSVPGDVPHLNVPVTELALRVEKRDVSVSGIMSGTPDIASRIPGKYRAGDRYAKKIEIKVTLFADKPFIDLAWSIEGKQEEPWPEAGWLCFPLKTTSPEYRLGKLGSVVNPAGDIVAGADSDMYSLATGIAVKDGDEAVVISPVDSPLACLGYPKLWHYHAEYEPPPESTVFVNLFNNTWGTNFQQWIGGSWTSRVRIWHSGDYEDGKDLQAASRTFRMPLVAIAAAGGGGDLPAHASGLELSREDVFLTAFGRNPFGEDTILRLWEQSGKDGSVDIVFPPALAPSALQPCDLYSRPNGDAIAVKNGRCTVTIRRNAPATFLLVGE